MNNQRFFMNLFVGDYEHGQGDTFTVSMAKPELKWAFFLDWTKEQGLNGFNRWCDGDSSIPEKDFQRLLELVPECRPLIQDEEYDQDTPPERQIDGTGCYVELIIMLLNKYDPELQMILTNYPSRHIGGEGLVCY